MNESTVSSAFQKKLREALPAEAVVVKHADKSMIGMVDASVTYNGHTFWLEYKLVCPTRFGTWFPESVASSSPTQYALAQRLAKAGHCIYLFWVLDHEAIRKRVSFIEAWHPITKEWKVLEDNNEVVELIIDLMKHHSYSQAPMLW